MAAKKSSGRKSSAKASKSVERAMHKFKRGTLKAGSGDHPKAKSREQAIAIGLSEAREEGANVPPPPEQRSTRSAGAKSTRKRSGAGTSTAKRGTTRRSTSRKRAGSGTSTRKRAGGGGRKRASARRGTRA